MGHLLLGFREHSQQNITPQSFGNQKLTAIAPERDVKGVACWQIARLTCHVLTDFYAIIGKMLMMSFKS
jgi:hypothetical protein